MLASTALETEEKLIVACFISLLRLALVGKLRLLSIVID